MDWGASGRRDAYRFTVVDPFTLSDIGEVDCIPSDCSITYGYYTNNYASASFTATNYENGLVRVYHTTELPDGTREDECLGTFFVDSKPTKTDEGFKLQSLTCYSTLWRLSKDFLASDFVAPSGTQCVTGLSNLITAEGASVIASPELPAKVHTRDVRFASTENRLSCIDEYAGWCNWTVGVDDYGYQTIEVYTPPANRAISYTFEAGENCVYLPDSEETETGSVCNRVVARWSEETVPDGYSVNSMRAVADLPPTNPLSYEVCGRRITHVLDLGPCSQTELQEKANEYLSQHDAAIRYFEIEHVGIPHLRAGQMVEYVTGEETLICEITQMSISSLAPLMMTKSKLKVIQ